MQETAHQSSDKPYISGMNQFDVHFYLYLKIPKVTRPFSTQFKMGQNAINTLRLAAQIVHIKIDRIGQNVVQ